MWFFRTHAGKGTAGVFLFAAIMTIPPFLTWLVAFLTLAWGIGHFRAACRDLVVGQASSHDLGEGQASSRDMVLRSGREMARK